VEQCAHLLDRERRECPRGDACRDAHLSTERPTIPSTRASAQES
jgi:hypothetical protein